MISTVVAKGILFAFSTTYPEAKPPNRPTINASVCAVDRMSTMEYNSVEYNSAVPHNVHHLNAGRIRPAIERESAAEFRRCSSSVVGASLLAKCQCK